MHSTGQPTPPPARRARAFGVALLISVASLACGASAASTDAADEAGGGGGAPGDGGEGGQPIPPGYVTVEDGIPGPLDGVYDDLGPAPLSYQLRALVGLPPRDVVGLEQRIRKLYDPASASFRAYLSPSAWAEAHEPAEADVAAVEAWLESVDLRVARRAHNRLLLEIHGSVGSFNEAFKTQLMLLRRTNPSPLGDDLLVYGTRRDLLAPLEIGRRITGVVTADALASADALPPEAGDVEIALPADVDEGFTVAQIAGAYDLAALYDEGFTGQGVKIGVVMGAGYRVKDLQSFWRSMGIERADPQQVVTMEPIATRYLESTLDLEWAGAIAPGATLIAYQGPDARNTSLLFTFNEAVARAEVSVVTDSFAHREDSEPRLLRRHYNYAAMAGAAFGMTVLSAAGNSGRPDVPSTCPYVTSVGGTFLQLDAAGGVLVETTWKDTGAGVSSSFARPYWQLGVVDDGSSMRAVTDVALNASGNSPYWVYHLGGWLRFGGTSFAAPVFAGMVAVINGRRAQAERGAVGWLNPALYTDPLVQSAFRDITLGSTEHYAARAGWDHPTGWGAPRAHLLEIALR